MNNGYVKLFRSFREWYGYGDPVRVTLWVELILCASHDEVRYVFNGRPVTLKPGEFVTGSILLSEATGISRTRVRELLLEFEKEGQIRQQKSNKGRLVSIVRWDEYQRSDSRTTAERTQSALRAHSERTQSAPIKNDKNDKNDKKNSVIPTLDEVANYCQERENGINPAKFIDFYEARGWMIGKNKMKDWKAAIRTWENRDKDRQSMPSGSGTLTETQKRNIGRINDAIMKGNQNGL